MSDGLRLFVAVPLPEEILRWLTGLQRALRSMGLAARWIRPQGMHLTVKFLGRGDPAQVETLGAALAAAAAQAAPFLLCARGVGVFPGIRGARVIWSGVAGDPAALVALARRIDAGLAPLGFPAEARPFHGHLTLGRIAAPQDPRLIVQAMERHGPERSPDFAVTHLNLLRSELLPGGARHTLLHSAALGGGGLVAGERRPDGPPDYES